MANNMEKLGILNEEQRKKMFSDDTTVLAKKVTTFVENFYPSYSNASITEDSLEKSWDFLRNFTFYRILDCTINKTDDVFKYFADKMQKFFITAYAIKRTVCYGIISFEGKTSLVLGMHKGESEISQTIIEGLFPGINLQLLTDFDVAKYNSKDASKNIEKDRYLGCISGIPALKIDGEYIYKDLSSLTRSLNGENYTLMVICKPLDSVSIQDKIDLATEIHDAAFSISKRTLSYSAGSSTGETITETHSESDGTTKTITKTSGMNGVIPAALAGTAVGGIAGGLPGAIIGGVGSGLVAMISGINFSRSKGTSESHTISDSYSEAISNSVNKNESISGDIQNGFALELMKMCESILERCKTGRNIGMWETVISYSAESEIASEIIKGSIYSEMASPIPEILPPITFSYKDSFMRDGCLEHNKEHNQHLLIPKGFLLNNSSKGFVSYVTSEELCGICTIPIDSTVGFSVQQGKDYPLDCINDENSHRLGPICEFNRPVNNSYFGLSNDDLNKHTFVCGITGSGKTNTVKKILKSVDVPFLVLEPAKKEYRHLEDIKVYSLGRTELNCIRINPFYLMPGVSPQQHIDLLKDLFNASFAFYGPMPYILEKCLNNVYIKKGWNLTLGFHPNLVNENSVDELFSNSVLEERYSNISHNYLFPTMKDLKDEIDRYVENELTYEGEVKGNIRGALQARIDSLCVSSKGYIFNTHESLNIDALLNEKAVVELEGLADDSDKSFALGLIIIYINELRAIKHELNNENKLKHLLVIEEAHRLLKNVSTDNHEDVGNPKGKAVEHFTNLLAEMRSYGQGVIVAEQIPTKLAPDVIKNTSNKIIHRLVSKDDQEVIANCVGMEQENAIYLGGLKTGRAICHKEGMQQPVIVNIEKVEHLSYKNDAHLYNENLNEKMESLSKSILENNYSDKFYLYSIKILVSIMYGIKSEELFDGIQNVIDDIKISIKLDSLSIPPLNPENFKKVVKEILKENIVSLLTRGVFSFGSLPNENIINLLEKVIEPVVSDEILHDFQIELEKVYRNTPSKKAVQTVAALVADLFEIGKYMGDICNAYLLVDNMSFCADVVNILKGVHE